MANLFSNSNQNFMRQNPNYSNNMQQYFHQNTANPYQNPYNNRQRINNPQGYFPPNHQQQNLQNYNHANHMQQSNLNNMHQFNNNAAFNNMHHNNMSHNNNIPHNNGSIGNNNTMQFNNNPSNNTSHNTTPTSHQKLNNPNGNASGDQNNHVILPESSNKNTLVFSRDSNSMPNQNNASSQDSSQDNTSALSNVTIDAYSKELEILIQDEKNASIFYKNLIDECRNEHEKIFISRASKNSQKNFEFLNLLYKLKNDREFKAKDVEIIKDIGFVEGIKVAILVENEVSFRGSELFDFITDRDLQYKLQIYLFKKMIQINFLNSFIN